MRLIPARRIPSMPQAGRYDFWPCLTISRTLYLREGKTRILGARRFESAFAQIGGAQPMSPRRRALSSHTRLVLDPQERASNRARFDLLMQVGEKFCEGTRAEVALALMADGDRARCGFFAADDEHVRNLLDLCVTDFGL